MGASVLYVMMRVVCLCLLWVLHLIGETIGEFSGERIEIGKILQTKYSQ